MALETRVDRRLLGAALAETLRRAEERKTDRFCRVLTPGPKPARRDVAYVLLIVAYPTHLNLAGGYEQYRKVRVNMLHAYVLHTFSENRHLRRVVGIAMDASAKVTGRQGGSEDILAMEVPEWTEELEQRARELREQFDVMDPERVERGASSTDEYPDPPLPGIPAGLSRQQRRALERARRKVERRRAAR
jgi:hypothetical protein